MSSVNDIINQINRLSGISIPSSSVVYTSGALSPGTSSEYPNATVYVPATAPYGTIPTTGIYPGGVIKSEQVLRIINALNGVNVDTIIISGSLLTSGSNVFEGTVAFPFLNEGDFLFITGGLLTGSNSILSASHVVSSSYAFSSSHALTADNATTASYALFSEYGTGVIGATVTLNQSTPASIWNFNHRLGVQYPVVTVYDNATNSEIIPQAVVPTDANNLQIVFASPRSGHAVAVVGGGYYATTSGSTRQLDQTVAATTWSFNHGIGTEYPVFQVYDADNNVIYPANIYAVDQFNAELYFNTPTAGTAVAMVGGIVNANAATASYANTASFAFQALSASYFSGSISNAIFALTASYALTSSLLIGGGNSAQVTSDSDSIFLIRSNGNRVFNVDSTGNVVTNGSITVETTGSVSNFLLIKNDGNTYVKVNNEGVLVLSQFDTPPTAVSGGMYFDTVGNFFIGL
jgi:hypothetical protein